MKRCSREASFTFAIFPLHLICSPTRLARQVASLRTDVREGVFIGQSDRVSNPQEPSKVASAHLIHTAQKKSSHRLTMTALPRAERGGFEPPVPCGTQHFQCCTIGHSVTSPKLVSLPSWPSRQSCCQSKPDQYAELIPESETIVRTQQRTHSCSEGASLPLKLSWVAALFCGSGFFALCTFGFASGNCVDSDHSSADLATL
jgi:hypothetical protein